MLLYRYYLDGNKAWLQKIRKIPYEIKVTEEYIEENIFTRNECEDKVILKSSEISTTISEILKTLIGSKVLVVLRGDNVSESVEIEAVIGNILLAKTTIFYKFININCICEIILERNDILENILVGKVPTF